MRWWRVHNSLESGDDNSCHRWGLCRWPRGVGILLSRGRGTRMGRAEFSRWGPEALRHGRRQSHIQHVPDRALSIVFHGSRVPITFQQHAPGIESVQRRRRRCKLLGA